jgi:acid phosphatase (class A)
MKRALTLQLIAAAMVLAGGLASCTTHAPSVAPQEPSASPLAGSAGYLKPEQRPSSASLLPSPPAPDSKAFALDEEVSQRYLAMHGSARWDLARQDAVLTFPAAVDAFTCAVGTPISEQDTPRLYRLMRRTLTDAGASTSEAKAKYQRTRPFMVNGKPLCTPDREQVLRRDGSYPSGHSAIGWTWALVLAEVAPERADAILARGRAFGQSRLACNVHWQSDVVEGRMVAAATVARLHAQAEFRSDLEAATSEIATARQRGLAPKRDCAAEAKALEEL